MKTPSALQTFFENAKTQALSAIETLADADYRRFFRRRWIFLLSYLRRDKWPKIACLVLAAFAFYYIRLNVLDSAQFNVAIKPVLSGESPYSILETAPASVMVKVRGQFQHAPFKTQEGLQLQLPVKYKGNKTVDIRLNRRMFMDLVERDVSIVDIDPDSVKITFDEDTTKKFLVSKPETVNEPVLQNYTLDIQWEKEIEVSGPQSVLENYPADYTFKTAPVELAGRSRSFSEEVAIIRGPNTENLKFSKEKIPVKVFLEDTRVERRIDGVTFLLAAASGDGNRYVSDPAEISVSLKGREESLNDISASNIFAIVECHPDRVPEERTAFVGLRPREQFSDVEIVGEYKATISIEQPPEPEPQDNAEVQEALEAPEVPENPETPEKPDVPEVPEAPETPPDEPAAEPAAAEPATADEPPPPEAPQ